ncbi:MAG TPA: rod shape-determining protein MreC [Chitinophagaceae bacterium]
MKNIFLFIRRYFTFFAFLALQAVALWFLFNYNRFHRAKGLGWANEITGRINSQFDKGEDFFNLKEENKRVHRTNDSLMNLLRGNFIKPDTSNRFVKDSIPYDTLGHYRRYIWRDAKVVYTSVNADKNYIQLNRGSNAGIKDNMAVINSDGSAVGVVVNVSPNFCQVMSLLHVQNKVKGELKKSGDFGTVEWDGKDPRYLTLKDIPGSVKIEKGDTVLTSKVSFNFPPGFMIGTIQEVIADKSTNFYVLKIKTAANFYNLQQVFVVENIQYDEQVKLNEATKKKIEDPKNNQP